ncbi:phosphotransferase [Paenibacillus sp. B2(2019)]|uniref:phosphotransferase n=1 Tax=Paenibacillus sp. B2(2019) TaxID=2607754 RepID=UPI0011F17266|nr:phosphotransferase [Paenibacillus sp. B2(2019)]KAA1191588.1 phosphotransferase [Paenibacillus sp. B2(2019)]
MLENKMDQLNISVQRIFGEQEIEIVNFTCEDLDYKTPNFTTAGIFHLQGIALINNEQLPWSIILKIIKSDSVEKEDPAHHNYWRREALVFESKILDELPSSIQAPKCYLVEEQVDGTVWLWMERIDGGYAHTKERFDFIAEQLGRFNGAYLNVKNIPDAKWICRSWLKSWTTASKMYAPNPEEYIHQLLRDNEKNLWTWFKDFTNQIDSNLNALHRLPRVLAHQDLSQMNMLLTQTGELVLIDWQFMSISGLGEDLGKMFGVNMSLGVIPIDRYEEFKESLFHSYIKGLKASGWQGDESLARYGYCLSTALRSVWEVPQYFSLNAQLQSDLLNANLQERVNRLEQIIIIHQKMTLEAETLKLWIT